MGIGPHYRPISLAGAGHSAQQTRPTRVARDGGAQTAARSSEAALEKARETMHDEMHAGRRGRLDRKASSCRVTSTAWRSFCFVDFGRSGVLPGLSAKMVGWSSPRPSPSILARFKSCTWAVPVSLQFREAAKMVVGLNKHYEWLAVVD
jgi:hypothetical protein